MNLVSSLRALPELLQQHKVICFRAEAPSALFFSSLCKHLKAQSISYSSIDATELSLPAARQQLEMSFLGQQQLFWIKNLHHLESNSKSWLDYLQHYQGPHTLVYSHQTAPSAAVLTLELPDRITKLEYSQLVSFFHGAAHKEGPFIDKLFARMQTLQLDAAFLVMGYHTTLGRRCDDFFDTWFESIVTPQTSLFTLSQYFFARQQTAFFSLWQTIGREYPPEFWIAYWAEQLWQALIFVQAAQQKSPMEAKKLISRLPFSFINKDWRLHTVATLTQAHHALYTLDYLLKNGAGTHGLELWYYKFLLKSF